MLAAVSNSRAPHDGFAVLVVIVLVIAACFAGYWYAEKSGGMTSGQDRSSLAIER
jgi:hypothetical protein